MYHLINNIDVIKTEIWQFRNSINW